MTGCRKKETHPKVQWVYEITSFAVSIALNLRFQQIEKPLPMFPVVLHFVWPVNYDLESTRLPRTSV